MAAVRSLSCPSRNGAKTPTTFLIYGAYGNVMHKFQVLELGLWSFQQIKPGASFDQAMAKVEKWNGSLFARRGRPAPRRKGSRPSAGLGMSELRKPSFRGMGARAKGCLRDPRSTGTARDRRLSACIRRGSP